jgi:uncharacterized metal-binding protein YceD (DUF177 family)
MSAIPFSFVVEVAALPPKGRDYDLTAKPDEQAAIAQSLGLESLGSLTAHLAVTPAAGGMVNVTGTVTADVVQACVVTLAPVPSHIHEDIARRFMAEAPRDPDADAPEGEGWVDPSDEITDPLIDGKIDLGEIVTEQLSLALDPYPRAPGATFTGLGEQERKESPFAALASLKVGKAGPRRGQAKARSGKKGATKGKKGGK